MKRNTRVVKIRQVVFAISLFRGLVLYLRDEQFMLTLREELSLVGVEVYEVREHFRRDTRTDVEPRSTLDSDFDV